MSAMSGEAMDTAQAEPRAAVAPLPASVPTLAAFGEAEYASRIDQSLAAARQAGLDGLVVVNTSNVFYLSGVESQGAGHVQAIVLPVDGEPVLVTWEFERGAALLTGGPRRIVTYGWFDDPVEALAGTVRELGLGRSVIGIDLRHLSAATYAQLRRALPEATLRDSFGIVEGRRLRKSPAELDYMRAAARMSDAAVVAALAAIAPGRRDTEVAAVVAEALYAAGSETVCWGPIVATGYGAGLMHTSVHGRTLERGDTVFLELSGQARHYVAPVMRTAVLGAPNAEMIRVRDAGLAAIEAILESARPGAIIADVVRAAVACLAPVLDVVDFHQLYGYSVGIGFPPSWFEPLGFELRLEETRPLEAGMVFHVPISLRRFGVYGVSQSQTIVVSSDEPEILSASSPALVVVE